MRMKHLIMVALLALVGAACSGSDDGGAIETPDTIDADVVGTIQNTWQPATFKAAVGATVTWEWDGLHNVVAEDGSFDSGEAVEGGSFEYTFDTAGTFAYMCEVHGAPMSGTIDVE